MASLRLPSLSTLQIPPPSFSFHSHRTLQLQPPFLFETRTYIRTRKWKVPRMQAADEDYDLKQMRDMASARKRWEALVREGKVKPLSPKEAGYAIQLSNKTLLDVRPEQERKKKWKVPRMQAAEEDYDLKQMRDMASARKRWEALVREGKVKPLSPKEAGYAIQLSNKTLLDVRPEQERKKAWVKGSTWVPIFDNNDSFDIGTLSTKATNFVMGGWWSGAPTLSYNKRFLASVQEKFEDDTDLIVACQKGLRSLAACELLCNAGYENVFWVQGGLEAAEEEELPREGPQPFKFAGIGGLSEFLGWTDQQRVVAAKEGWQYRFVYSARLVGLFVAVDGLFIAFQQAGRYIQELKTH